MDDIEKVSSFAQKMKDSIKKSFCGSDEAVHFAVLGLASSLHVLIEDVPGVGKTTLAKSLSNAVGLSFSRIQFTPDMLPSDILGMNVWNPTKNEFYFKEGSINSQIILADELNRTSPRTQAAFLEAMQEGQITIDGQTKILPKPFFLIATQNPQNFIGTFPLPEAELDRFGLSFSIGYPSKEDELKILNLQTEQNNQPISDENEVKSIRQIIKNVHISDCVQKFIVEIVRATRNDDHIKLGASPRSSVYLQHASRAQAAFNGRKSVIPEDILQVAPIVLSHRIILSSSARLDHLDSKTVIKMVCKNIPIPTGL